MFIIEQTLIPNSSNASAIQSVPADMNLAISAATGYTLVYDGENITFVPPSELGGPTGPTGPIGDLKNF